MFRANSFTLTSKRFVIACVALWLATFAYFSRNVPLSIYADPFGLWHTTEPRKIYDNERLSKYLLAQHYVPKRFDGLLVGPSLCANLDTRQLRNYRVYNLSVAGGNASELKHILA